MQHIPILIICYNNYKYVDNMINQLIQINPEYKEDIYIVNNCSTCKETIDYLLNAPVKIIQNNSNNGPWISQYVNTHIYDTLPSRFILTDADLQLNPNLPPNFIEILVEMSCKYNAYKLGLALDISDFEKMYQGIYVSEADASSHLGTIQDWEKQFWENKIIEETKYDLYSATIDTTFCCIHKNYTDYHRQYRMGGIFTAKHIPWYIDNPFYSIEEIYKSILETRKISTTSRLIIPYVEENYEILKENDEIKLKRRNNI